MVSDAQGLSLQPQKPRSDITFAIKWPRDGPESIFAACGGLTIVAVQPNGEHAVFDIERFGYLARESFR